ncbi:hypothetical protein GCM10025879_20560 [Leuconostoc litchii]|uniref:Uncharacterized protein n=1 Tax=Leuconostoc litchii TaxID=1981069 RepID=A0A6P2CN76_9LACO|nr:hypothetical protein [Leuconostoc litchii]TYC46843.1 hypothetical protein ESZ47_01495 [Leuconostoc litchii]GMA70738.1 hypothetical protein GCM10025879_19840 [Leuconostoc litchii]GMA70810.1 hypothetical protein GCM10025879_20560 [Leuconostoc litchii]
MTFDEATENINVLSAFSSGYGISPTAVREIISTLKEEYAPTIEMTKIQHSVFVDEMEDIATQEYLDLFITDGLDLGDMTVREALNAWIKPETIKVVDE